MNFLQENRNIESGDELGCALIQMIEQNLDLVRLGFRQIYSNFAKPGYLKVIYNSESCRIKFTFSRQQLPQYDELSIDYGRLHALDEEPFMPWKGEKCRCWHNILDPLRFLDGLSPFDAMQQAKVTKQLPHVVRDFRYSDLGKKLLDEYPPKSAIVLQSFLWKRYNSQLFELFDLRRPDLWDAYRQFIKEYYALLGMKAGYGPPYENIC